MKKQVVGKAMEGPGPKAKHTHPVVLTGKFKKEEAKEASHARPKRGKVSGSAKKY
jgi:hypothetical protein